MFELNKTNPDAENVQHRATNFEQLNMTEQRSVHLKTCHPMVGSYVLLKKGCKLVPQ